MQRLWPVDKLGERWSLLRHSCAFTLADKGHDLRLIQDYLGHRDPRHTDHYTRTSGRRFEGCGDDF